MKLDKWVTGDSIRIRIQGELDALSAGTLRAELAGIPEAAPREVELDLGELKLIDSSGAGAIVWLYKQLQRTGARLCVAGLNGQPRVVFELLGLNRVIALV